MIKIVSRKTASSIRINFFLDLLVLIVAVRFLPVCQSTVPSQSAPGRCNETCGGMRIPYPFGITTGCGLPEFNLTCTSDATLNVSIDSQQYKILNFTTTGIIIDIPNCSSDFALFDDNKEDIIYTVSPNNYLSLYSCKHMGNCPNASFFTMEESCGGKPQCAYGPAGGPDQPGSTYNLNLTRVGCSSFSSWVFTLSIQSAQRGLELDWAIPGVCGNSSCGVQATCIRHRPPAHTCECENGSLGDPYPFGSGCSNPPGKCEQMKTGDNCQGDTVVTTRKALLIASILAGASVLAAIIVAFALIKRRSFRTSEKTSRFDARQIAEILSLRGNASKVKVFAYKDLEKATKGFSRTQMLGHGAHGTVYAGKLQDGREVAVKRINNINKQEIEVLMNELILLSTVNHKNLVQLLGCCLEVRDPLLVYEFVSNGTLSEHLQRQRGEGLDWCTRITIATEAAQALAYLHSTIDPPIYHRDVKTSNILIDSEYSTKVADFGLSRLALTEGSHISTVPQGTPGYLDPEYHQNFRLSDKSDVYSFGVVLIEIITGMKVVDFNRQKQEINLAALALARITNGTLDEIIDPFLKAYKQPYNLSMIQRVAELAFRCLSHEKDARPTMAEVAEELEMIRLSSICPGGDQSPLRDISIFMDKNFKIIPR